MKRYLVILFLLIVSVGYAQTPIYPTATGKAAFNWYWFGLSKDSLWRIKLNTTGDSLTLNNRKVKLGGTGGSGSDSVITAGAISSLPTLAFNPGSNITAAKWIQTVYYQTQAPTATLTGGTQAELHSSGTTTATLNWSGSRQAATATLSTIVVDGVSQSFVQPAQPGTVSGTKSVTVTYNSTNTFTNTVTTTDAKTASATTSFTFLPSRYWGRSASTTPNNSTILAVAGGSSELSSSKAKSAFTVTASGSNYIYFAYPLSLGVLTSIYVGGFESFSAFTRTTVNVTNASGYVQDYYVYTSNNTFSGDATQIVTQ